MKIINSITSFFNPAVGSAFTAVSQYQPQPAAVCSASNEDGYVGDGFAKGVIQEVSISELLADVCENRQRDVSGAAERMARRTKHLDHDVRYGIAKNLISHLTNDSLWTSSGALAGFLEIAKHLTASCCMRLAHDLVACLDHKSRYTRETIIDALGHTIPLVPENSRGMFVGIIRERLQDESPRVQYKAAKVLDEIMPDIDGFDSHDRAEVMRSLLANEIYDVRQEAIGRLGLLIPRLDPEQRMPYIEAIVAMLGDSEYDVKDTAGYVVQKYLPLLTQRERRIVQKEIEKYQRENKSIRIEDES